MRGNPYDEIGALLRRDARELVPFLPTAHHVKAEGEDSCLQTRKRALTRNGLCQHLDLGLLASGVMRK